MIRLSFMVLALISMTPRVMGQAPASVATMPSVPSRLAVISTADTADLAALITAELSSHADISLIERDDLAKIGNEAKLQQLASTDATALGKLAGADGLVFLDNRSDGLHIRFTAVNLGYALFDDPVPADFNAVQEAKAIGHLISIDVAKLKLDATKAIPISILNLRFDIATTSSATVERDLTLLLESRLSSVPEFVVLERRHAWNLGFEHSLAASPAPLLEGAFLLDGTLRINGDNGKKIAVQLRMRNPISKQEKSLEATGSVDDLSALVGTLATQIIGAIGAPASASTWDPKSEGREYLFEGIWAWEHEQPQAAVEALDSAELLGETAPDLLATRIQALCQIVVPDLNPAEIQFIGDPNVMATIFQHANPTHDYTPLQPLADRLALVRRAIADLAVYSEPSGLRSYHLQFLDPKWQHVVQLAFSRRFVIHAASHLLAELDQQNDPETGPFREDVRQLAGFDPLNGKVPDDQGDGAFYADEWTHSFNEEIAYYRQVITAPGTENQFDAVFLKERFINERGMIFCPRFVPNADEQKQSFVQFAQNLEQTSEGKLGGLLILSNNSDRSLAETSYAAFLDELNHQRTQLVLSGELSAHCLAAYDLCQRANSIQTKTASHTVPLLRYFLTKSSLWNIRTLQVLWLPTGFPPADAPAIWNEFKAYKARILDPKSPTGRYAFQEEAMFGAFESAYSQAFPDPGDAPKHPLIVTHFWQPCTDKNVPFFVIGRCETRGNVVAVEGGSPRNIEKLYLLQPPDFSAAPIVLPEGVFPFGFAWTSDAVYVTGFTREPPQDYSARANLHWWIYRYDLEGQSWDQHNLPLDFSVPVIVHDQLFLKTEGGGPHGAIARYDWLTQMLTLLCSDRRRPARNQFDDRTGYQILSLFPGIGNTIGTNIDFSCFTVSETPGKWPELIPGFPAQRAAPMGDKTLIEDYRSGICVLIDAAKSLPEVLFAPSNRPLPVALTAYGPARWQMDTTTILKFFDSSKGIHNDAIFSLVRHQTTPAHYELSWLDPAHRQPIHIPLQFNMDPANQALLRHAPGQPSNTVSAINPNLDPFPLQMVTTDEGICLWHPSAGLWFIPFADIEAYLKSASN